ncbi:glycosyltransferase [Metabacillus idriensis]|uniref:glycosyltransferase n=1 Tax=Metabacillus idriensis TaxID=324768 RepID=UPI00174EC7AF|nr:glycosyltransferase [Metabacillus idriensis]
MGKTHTVDFKEFMNGEYKHKLERNRKVYMAILTATGGYCIIGLPKGALAVTASTTGGGDPFNNLYEAAMRLFDGGVVIALVATGGMWAFGYRSQAIERIIYVGAGYILARHAKDIRDFFKTI